MSNLTDWEHSKENILPLRSGRDPKKLSEQFSTTNTDQASKVAERKTEFENAIRDYSGDDPLDLWVKYIEWMRQVKTTKSSEVSLLLEHVTTLFVDSQIYKNDFRFFKLWMYYTDLSLEPIEIFAFMESNGIAHSLSKMYEMRAFVLETRGRINEADKIYNLGLQRCVQVELEKLKQKYAAFQQRTMLKVSQMEPQEIGKRNENKEDENRTVLGNLTKNPGVNRTTVRGPPLKTTTPVNNESSLPQKRKNSTNSFQIYVDNENENVPPSCIIPNWKELGSETTKYKENTNIPSTWDGITIPQKKRFARNTPSTPFVVYHDEIEESEKAVDTPSSANSVPKLRVHCESESSQIQNNPLRNFTPQNTQKSEPQIKTVASTQGTSTNSTRSKSSKTQATPTIITSTDPHVSENGERLGYDRALLYVDNEEFSFEEVRATFWKPKRINNNEMMQVKQSEQIESIELTEQKSEVQITPQTSPSIFKKEQEEIQVTNGLVDLLSPQSFSDRPIQSQEEKVLQPEKTFDPILNLLDISINPKEYLPTASTQILEPTILEPTKSSTVQEIAAPLPLLSSSMLSLTSLPTQTSNEMPTNSLLDSSLLKLNFTDPVKIATETPSVLPNTKHHMGIPLQMENFTSATPPHSNIFSQVNPNEDTLGNVTTSTFLTSPFLKMHVSYSLSSPTINTKAALNDILTMFNTPLSKNKGESKSSFGEDFTSSTTTQKEKLENQRVLSKLDLENNGGNTEDYELLDDQENVPPSSHHTTPATFSNNNNNVKKVLQPLAISTSSDVRLSRKLTNADVIRAELTGESVPWNAGQDITTEFVDTIDRLDQLIPKEDLDFEIFEDPDLDEAGKPKVEHVTTKENEKEGFSVFTDFDTPRKSLNSSLSLSVTSSPNHSTFITPASQKNNSTHLLTPLTPFSNEESVVLVPPVNPYDPNKQEELLNLVYDKFSQVQYFYNCQGQSPDCEMFSKPFLSKKARDEKKEKKKKQPDFEEESLNLPNVELNLRRPIAEGGFARVYLVDVNDNEIDLEEGEYALKVQTSSDPWEFHISNEIKNRLSEEERSNFSSFHSYHLYSDKAFLLMDFSCNGTLLDAINSYSDCSKKMEEPLIMFYAIELLRSVSSLHKAGIIHGDIKPDNILLKNEELPTNWTPQTWRNSGIKLIDFGHAIDTTLFPAGTMFVGKAQRSGFRCIEATEGRPWKYQVDYYGICGVLHCMLFSTHMEVENDDSIWKPKSPFKRYWNVVLWQKIFETLLNVSNSNQVDLCSLAQLLEDYLVENQTKSKAIKVNLCKQFIALYELGYTFDK